VLSRLTGEALSLRAGGRAEQTAFREAVRAPCVRAALGVRSPRTGLGGAPRRFRRSAAPDSLRSRRLRSRPTRVTPHPHPSRAPPTSPHARTPNPTTPTQSFNAAVNEALAHPDWAYWRDTVLPRYRYPPDATVRLVETHAAWREELAAKKAAAAARAAKEAAAAAAAEQAAAAAAEGAVAEAAHVAAQDK